MRRGLGAFQSTGTELYRPYFLWLLADGYGKAGQPSKGLAMLDEAQEMVEENEERYWEAEIYRLRGELLLMAGVAAAEAEPCFLQAIEIARRQQAKSLELRGVMSLARLWRQRGKREEARQMLAKIYRWFTEGFDTPDLKDAKALLDELQKPSAEIAGFPFLSE